MPIAFFAVIAALLYLAAAGLQLAHLVRRQRTLSRPVLGMAIVALICHAVVTWDALVASEGVMFGFYKVLALSFLSVNIACIGALLRRPLQNLLVVLLPLSALSIVIATLGPSTSSARDHIAPGMLLHIGSSIVAYSILTLAAGQAALLALQDQQLRNHNMQGITRALPPLQLMESMLFELVWVGVAVLTLSLLSGMVFMDNMFAQHLVHKTVLSLFAWFLFTQSCSGDAIDWAGAARLRCASPSQGFCSCSLPSLAPSWCSS